MPPFALRVMVVPLQIVVLGVVMLVGLVEGVATVMVCVTPAVVRLHGLPSTRLTQYVVVVVGLM